MIAALVIWNCSGKMQLFLYNEAPKKIVCRLNNFISSANQNAIEFRRLIYLHTKNITEKINIGTTIANFQYIMQRTGCNHFLILSIYFQQF